jgi:flagellar hook-basal body complex protein FliE
MNSLLLDLIVPGGRRPPRVIHDVVVGRVDDIQKTDSLNDGGNSVVDTLQQAGDQVADTLSQAQSVLLDTGAGGSSSSMWTVLIAVVALIACISLAIAYRRRTVANA